MHFKKSSSQSTSYKVPLVGFYINFVFAFCAWIVLFIATAISQHDLNSRIVPTYSYHIARGKIFSFVWWAIFYQLFVFGIALVQSFSVMGESWMFFCNSHLCNSLTIVALIQAILVTDRFIFSIFNSEIAVGVGALLIAIANFLWLWYFSKFQSICATCEHDRVLDREKSVGTAVATNAAGAEATANAPHEGYNYNVAQNERTGGDAMMTGDANKFNTRPSVSDTQHSQTTAAAPEAPAPVLNTNH
ncbi:hypothetical protein DASC09_059310 [Saccharomycopsis crataegensis]|uniref:Uncharacterized protein n=1 Tax=Saccharomycopsis crataegensis TaxID=43959 RepID=A0AAV5QUJ8_9ASCO|nr:hypothetical protein DASC09_059310 [Saccharomycopsis crataegensis]